MKNLKHTIIAIAAIVMVGTLSFFQVSDMSAKKAETNTRMSIANHAGNMTISVTENEIGTKAAAAPSTEAEIQEAEQASGSSDPAAEQAIAEKSYLTIGYANVTGSTELKQSPSTEAQSIGTMNGAEQLEILESTDGWYKVKVNGQSGYVDSSFVTLDKSVAADSAMQYGNYKRAVVASSSGLTVRSAPDSASESIGLVNNNDNVIIVENQGEYSKVLYGYEYNEGYVLNSGISHTGAWVSKTDVETDKQRVAAEKAEKARQAELARQAEEARQAAARRAAASQSSSAQKNAKAAQSLTPSYSAPASSSGRGQSIVNTAMNYLGVRYVWGGTSPSGFDCSGLVQYVCRKNGISVPRVAAAQRGAGRYVSRENLSPGDLVFFSNGGGVSHVGIYIGNGNMIHAPQTGDVVKVSSINTSYRVSHYAGAVRVW